MNNYIYSTLTGITHWITNNTASTFYSIANAYDPVATATGTMGMALLVKGAIDWKNGKASNKLIAAEILAGASGLALSVCRLFALQQQTNKAFSPEFDASGNPIFHFPSHANLANCIKNHPLTNSHNLEEEKMIRCLSNAFAETTLTSTDIEETFGLSFLMCNLKAQVPETLIIPMTLNLEQALKDCAN